MNQYFSITYDMTKLNDYEKRAVFKTAQKRFMSGTVVSAGWENPPVRKEPKEIIEAMIKSGVWQDVPFIQNYCGQISKGILKGEDLHYLTESNKDILQPYDPKTGKVIVDFVEGEIVTE